MCRKNKWNKIKSGWQNNKKDPENENKPELANDQVILNQTHNNFLEKILKAIIYGILYIAISRYLKSSRTKGKEIVNSAHTKLKSNEFAFIPIGYAMYLFLSFIPISLILVSIIASISPEYDTVFRYAILGKIIPGIDTILPKDISSIWTNPGGAISFLILTLSIIFFTSKGYSKFIISIDALYEHKTKYRAWKGWAKGIVVSISLIAILTLMLLLFTILMTFLIKKAEFGNKHNLSDMPTLIANAITNNDKSFTPLKALELKTEFWIIYYFIVVLTLPLFTYLGFAAFYLYAPSFKLKFNQVHPGALITAIPTSFFILIFGTLASIIKYDKFGPVAAFMYIILLVTFIAYFTYMGIIVNSSFYKTFINILTIDKKSIFANSKRN